MRLAIALAALACAGTASACGVCIEDKIAAVYDYATVTNAIAAKHEVIFFMVEGEAAATSEMGSIVARAVARMRGADKGTLRISRDAASVSFAFDPQRTTRAQVERSLRTALAKRALSVELLKVTDSAGVAAGARF